MTVRTIITRAARIVQEAYEGQPAAEAYVAISVGLNAFNDMMKEMRGVHIGQKLARVWDAEAGDTALPGGIYNCNVYVPEQPWNGDRFKVLGARTVTASDDTIESASSVVTTATTSWMYREDLGNWQKEEDATLDSASPLQDECNESLALLTAARIYLEQTGELTPTLSALASSSSNRIRQLYMNRTAVSVDTSLLRGLANRRWR